MKSPVILLAAGALVFGAHAGDLLFGNGKTAWKIVIPAKAAAPEQYAAEELKNTLRKISGADFIIRKDDSPAGKRNIVIGSPSTSPAVRKLEKPLQLRRDDADMLSVRTLNGNLYLTGSHPRGALYAVYSFLTGPLEVRWFWPGDGGEFIPARKSFELPDLNFTYRPPFRYRVMELTYTHLHLPTEAWLARNFMNMGSRTRKFRDQAGFVANTPAGHAVCIPGGDIRKRFAEHPEQFALVDGKRSIYGFSGCWSNPDFTKEVLERLDEAVFLSRGKMLCTYPADTPHRCSCEKCTAIHPDPSSRWFVYYEKLMKELRRQYPDLKFASIAYQEYQKVPQTPVRGLEYVAYCQYDRCFIHGLHDPDCKSNRDSVATLKRWQEKTPMGIYGYEFCALNKPMYMPIWNVIADEMKVYRDMKMVYMKTEMPTQYPKNARRAELKPQIYRLAYYMYAQLMWNPDADVNALLRDWCDKVYGPAGKALFAYHRRMAEAWDNCPGHTGYLGNSVGTLAKNMLNPEVIQFCRDRFNAADKAVRNLADARLRKRCQEEVDLEKELFRNWVKEYHLAGDGALSVNLPCYPAGTDFASLPELHVTGRAGDQPLPTEMRMYWSEQGLHIQVIAGDSAMKNLRKGSRRRDASGKDSDRIEVAIDLNDNSPSRRFCVNAAGGICDACGADPAWNPDWKSSVKLEKDRWIAEMTIPFRALGASAPEEGRYWKISIVRHGRNAVCGFPSPVDRNLSQGANVFFSEKSSWDDKLVWISISNHRFTIVKGALQKDGWLAKGYPGPEGVMNIDTSDARMFFIETFRNDMPREFYEQKLIPAVKNGAVAVFNCYYGVEKLHVNFNDPTYKMVFRPDIPKIRRPSWVTGSSFATTPNKISLSRWQTPPGNLIPAHPESWEILAKQLNSKGDKDYPIMMARPLGKGMILLVGTLRPYQIPLILANAREYNKVISRKSAGTE